MKPSRYKFDPRKTPKLRQRGLVKDPVEVYCRLRPLENDNDRSCLKIIDERAVQLAPADPTVNLRNGTYKEIRYTFKEVFDDSASQKTIFDIVALPLVSNLLDGTNGLIFTYGVTGSGKTYTMTGVPQDGGIMPRCLDVIFNSIMEYQARKYVFKPDKLNGFDVQSEADAMLERQSSLYSQFSGKSTKTPRRKEPGSDISERVPDDTKVDNINEDNAYAVFVTYIEIYNNYAYDLLEDQSQDPMRQAQKKIIREDARQNVYVHGATEVEVKSTEEAFDVFYRGQKKRKMAHTNLNAESSRSHSVFTIRLVQAPLDSAGDEVLQDSQAVCVSQLSLVDLAGSERTNRTNNVGNRLREASNINSSLMTLRACLEILRENQVSGSSKKVPYRESKLTHLFKNYFEGEGQVSMLVCVNPKAEDYDENIHVMKFAEMTQEVQVSRPEIGKCDLPIGLTPGRRRANKEIRKLFQQAEEREGENGHTISLRPPFPLLELRGPDDDVTIRTIATFLKTQHEKDVQDINEFANKYERLRSQLFEIEKKEVMRQHEERSWKNMHEQDINKIQNLIDENKQKEIEISNWRVKYEDVMSRYRRLEQESEELKLSNRQLEMDKENQKHRLVGKITEEKKKAVLVCKEQMKEQRHQYKSKIWERERKIQQMKKILIDDTTSLPPSSTASSEVCCPLSDATNTPREKAVNTPAKTSSRKAVGVSNPRHRRSRSVGDDKWLDHRPAMAVELGTVMQPQMKKKKSITRLTDVKDVANNKVSKYCLTTHEQDSAGELETKLYKADIVPTVGGGAQVIFNDVETLKQTSPTANSNRKRSMEDVGTPVGGNFEAVSDKCAISVEGHSWSSKKRPRL